ncbi:hypothetical protein ACLOJK_004371 [Asimina triloba]
MRESAHVVPRHRYGGRTPGRHPPRHGPHNPQATIHATQNPTKISAAPPLAYHSHRHAKAEGTGGDETNIFYPAVAAGEQTKTSNNHNKQQSAPTKQKQSRASSAAQLSLSLSPLGWAMATIIGMRDGILVASANSSSSSSCDLYSPAKEKAATRGVYNSRSPLLWRARNLPGAAKLKLLLAACVVFALFLIAGRLGSLMGWDLHQASSVSSPSRYGGFSLYLVVFSCGRLDPFWWFGERIGCFQTARLLVWCLLVESLQRIFMVIAHYDLDVGLQKIVEMPMVYLVTQMLEWMWKSALILSYRSTLIVGVLRNTLIQVLLDLLTSGFSTSVNAYSYRSYRWGGYTVLINTWKRNSLLKQAVAHYASCGGTDAIRVVWSETDLPSDSLKAYLKKIVLSKSSVHKPNFRLNLYETRQCSLYEPWAMDDRNCEDIAMSLLVANATGAPPIWVKG